MTPAEWDCEGCGVHVYALGVEAPPAHQMCAVCAWLCEFMADDPEGMVALRARLEGSSAPRGATARRVTRIGKAL